MNNIININNFSVQYYCRKKYLEIIKNLNLRIEKKQIISIIGESGSGKTTLIKAIMKLLPQNAKTSGKLAIFGKIYNSENEMQEIYGNKIGMTFQDPFLSLNPTLKIKSQIAIIIKKKYGKINEKEIHNKSYELLKKLNFNNIEEVLDSYPSEISGGMNQKINIALSLEFEPEIMIFDEPTSALDYDSQDEVIDLVLDYYKRKKPLIIFVTHNIVLAKKISDRIIIMKDGCILDDSPKTDNGFIFNSEYARLLYNNALYEKNKSYEIRSSKKLIELKNIKKNFKKKEVLKNTNFTLCKGETVGIIGKTGIGKTTLCKIICGLYKASEGEIFIDKNTNIEMVFQSAKSSLDSKLKIREILNESNKINKKELYEDKVLLNYIKDFNLPVDTLERYPTELSGGQNQKIAIIRALLNHPNVIIFDEPTSSLDVNSQKDILDIINKIKEKNSLSYIFISHNPQVINYMCNRIIKL